MISTIHLNFKIKINWRRKTMLSYIFFHPWLKALMLFKVIYSLFGIFCGLFIILSEITWFLFLLLIEWWWWLCFIRLGGWWGIFLWRWRINSLLNLFLFLFLLVNIPFWWFRNIDNLRLLICHVKNISVPKYYNLVKNSHITNFSPNNPSCLSGLAANFVLFF